MPTRGDDLSGTFASETLAENVSAARPVLDAFPHFAMLVTEAHVILLENAALKAALGRDDLPGTYCPRSVHGLDGPFPGCPLECSVQGGYVACERDLFDPALGRWIRSAVYPTSIRTRSGDRVFLHTAVDVTENVTAHEEKARRGDALRVGASVLRSTLENRPLGEVFDNALARVHSIEWLSLQAKGSVFLVDPDAPDTLVLVAHRGLSEPLTNGCARVPFGRCLCGRAAATGEIVFADRVDDRHDTRYEGIPPHGHYCVPIRSSGRVVGVLNLYVEEGHRRRAGDEAFLSGVADALASAIDRWRAQDRLDGTLRSLRDTMNGVIQALARTVETRDPYTAGHQQRVAAIGAAIATEMGLPDRTAEGVRIAGLLHDVGKICVPAEILVKPARLDAFEFGIMKRHCEVGHGILEGIRFDWPIARIVHQHHERLDGTGYPGGLRGEDILPEARILAIADVAEAMASHRPYRPALGAAAALAEILRLRGIAFDPDAVDALERLVTRKGLRLSE